jgi:hypothetical protein
MFACEAFLNGLSQEFLFEYHIGRQDLPMSQSPLKNRESHHESQCRESTYHSIVRCFQVHVKLIADLLPDVLCHLTTLINDLLSHAVQSGYAMAVATVENILGNSVLHRQIM